MLPPYGGGAMTERSDFSPNRVSRPGTTNSPDSRGETFRLEPRAFAAVRRPLSGREPLQTAARTDTLIQAIAAGDHARFRELFETLAPRAKAYLMQRGLPASVAEALAIEALVEVWRTARSFDPSSQYGQSWIFQRLRHVARRAGVMFREVGP